MYRHSTAPRLVGRSAAFRETLRLAEKYARSDWPILILGETGVGKEELARYLHSHSGRSGAPFFPVNCAALPLGLFESELFGHERGAFSGALHASKGILRSAAGGSVFLDEIGDLEIPLQAKLLRVLDSGEVRAVGSAQVQTCDFRLIAATNVNLHRAVASRRFRADLLERIHVLVIEIPPLRARREDISLLARHFLSEWGIEVEESVCKVLEEFDWPTNVRQLLNFLKRVVAQGPPVHAGLFQRALAEERRYFALAREVGGVDAATGSLAEIEKQVILQRLSIYRGNRKATAKDLGIAKSTLHDKLRKFRNGSVGDLDRSAFHEPRHGGSGRSNALDL